MRSAGRERSKERREEKGNSCEATKMCVFLSFGRLVGFLCSLGCLRVFLRHDWPLQENKLSEVLKNEFEIVAKHFEPLSVQTLLFNMSQPGQAEHGL